MPHDAYLALPQVESVKRCMCEETVMLHSWHIQENNKHWQLKNAKAVRQLHPLRLRKPCRKQPWHKQVDLTNTTAQHAPRDTCPWQDNPKGSAARSSYLAQWGTQSR